MDKQEKREIVFCINCKYCRLPAKDTKSLNKEDNYVCWAHCGIVERLSYVTGKKERFFEGEEYRCSYENPDGNCRRYRKK